MAVLTGNYISLFAGVAGFDLAVRIAFPGARCVCLVENEVNAATVLAARIKEGCLDDCPIWSNVRSFPSDIFRGSVDGIIGGFPCTDLSVAGRQAGIHGEHSGLWFEYLRIIREVQPRWVAIENVPAVIAFPAGGIVLSGLAESGFNAEWLSLRASAVGAAHGRNRVFILAHRSPGGRRVLWQPSRSSGLADRCDAELVHTTRDERNGPHREAGPGRGICEASNGVADTEREDGGGQPDAPVWTEIHRTIANRSGAAVADAGDGLLPEPWRRPEGRDGAGPAVPLLANTKCGSAQCEHEPGGARRGWPESTRSNSSVADADNMGAVGESGIVRSAEAEREGARQEWQRDGCSAGHDSHELADTECAERRKNIEHDGHPGERVEAPSGSGSAGIQLGNADFPGLEGWEQCGGGLSDQRTTGPTGDPGLPLFAPGPGATEQWQRILAAHPFLSPAISTETIERIICDMDDGLAAVLAGSRTDGLRACGNGIVATQAALALTVLARRLDANP